MTLIQALLVLAATYVIFWGVLLVVCMFFERVVWGKPRIEEIENE